MNLMNVAPQLSSDNLANRTCGNTVLLFKHCIRRFPLCMFDSHLANNFTGCFCHTIFLSACLTVFRKFVLNVVWLCAKPQVNWTNTGWVITSRTIVVDLKAVWNQAISYYPSNPMGTHMLAAKLKLPITALASLAGPQPAPVHRRCFVHIVKKPLLRCFETLKYVVELSSCRDKNLFRFNHSNHWLNLERALRVHTGEHFDFKETT